MKRNLWSFIAKTVTAASIILSPSAFATHCPSLYHAHSEITRNHGTGSPIIAVFHDPSHSKTLWQAITVPFEGQAGRGDYWNFVIAEISAKTQSEARAIAESTFNNHVSGNAFGSLNRDGHLFCGYTMTPPFLAAAKSPLQVPADATYDDVE